MKKTIREWYNKLPQQIKKEAIKNTPKKELKLKASCLSDAIQGGFVWTDTKQGYKFWDSVYVISEYFENN